MTKKVDWRTSTFLFAIGFLSLSLEVLGTQVVFLFHAHSSHALALSLSFFLCGLAGGNWLVHRYNSFFLEQRGPILNWIVLGLALLSGPLLSHFESLHLSLVGLKNLLPSIPPRNISFPLISFLYLFVPALPIGILFPLISDHSLRSHEQMKTRLSVGWLNSLELIGAVAGSIIAGFLFIPWLGLSNSFWCVTFLCAVLAMLLSIQPRWSYRAMAVICGAFALARLSQPSFELPMYAKGSQILFQKASPYGTVTAIVRANEKSLFINQRQMCGSRSWESERELARLAMRDWRAEEKNILNIGLGCGFTADEILRSQSAPQLDIVEINKSVVEAAGMHFREENNAVLENPRSTVIITDGFAHLQNSEKTYHRIIIDIEEPTIIHSSAFYTQEGFQLVKKKLAADGVFALWSIDQTETAKIILNTLRSVFREARVFSFAGQVVFIATDGGLQFADQQENSRVKEIEANPLKDIATITANPYPRYFQVNQIFGLGSSAQDPFEIKPQ